MSLVDEGYILKPSHPTQATSQNAAHPKQSHTKQKPGTRTPEHHNAKAPKHQSTKTTEQQNIKPKLQTPNVTFPSPPETQAKQPPGSCTFHEVFHIVRIHLSQPKKDCSTPTPR
jgi:hypothetical protein